MEDVVILGAGAAGLTAAIYCARANMKPLVISGGSFPLGQLTTTSEVENYPGFAEGIDGPKLMDEMKAQAERFGTRFQSGMDMLAVDSDLSGSPLKLTLKNGDEIETRSLIIATGADARYLGLESEQIIWQAQGGVSACAVCDGAFYRDVDVAVVGGGDTAMEEATYLTKYASKVYLLHRREGFRASKVMLERARANEKIEIRTNVVVDEVKDVEKKVVTGLVLRDTQTDELSELAVEGLFIAIGHKPNSDPFKGQLDMDETGYLITDNTKTNIPGVFAAGDVQDHVYRQAITAAGTGCMAALEAERYLAELND